MANPNKPAGLVPVQYLNAAPWNGKGHVYSYLAAETAAIYVGDQVVINGSGCAAQAGTPGGIPSVSKVADGNNACTGAVIAIGTNPNGPFVNPADLTKVFRPSGAQSVDYFFMVEDDPNVLFEIQEDSVGGSLTKDSVGLNLALQSATPTTGVVVSATQLDSSATGNANGTVKVMRLIQRPDNALGTNAKWLVKINNHTFAAPTASI